MQSKISTSFLSHTLELKVTRNDHEGGCITSNASEFSIIKSPLTLLEAISSNLYLVKNLVRRDLNHKYRNAILGYVWTFLEPALLASVYYVLFIIIANHSEPNYPMYVLLGVIGWGMFSRILNGTVNSLTKVPE